jgi:tetratricopeptide (TPR) repeat protein
MTLRLPHLFRILVLGAAFGLAGAAMAHDANETSEDTRAPADDLLRAADTLLSAGEFGAAEGILSEGLRDLSPDVAATDRFTLHYALALIQVRLGRVDAAILSFVEAIALADSLKRGEAAGYDGLALSLRLELAGFLLDSGRAGDSEALCWDALGRSLDHREPPGLGRVVVALVSAVLAQTQGVGDLRSFLSELDGYLAAWDGYRLSLPPPPEPIFALLEEGAARLLAEGETAAASRLFEGILRLDRARSADWRIVPDLSAVAFASLLTDDLGRARRALTEAHSALGRAPVPVDIWANRCYLAALEADWATAEVQCTAGIAAARSGGDERRAIAMTSVLAGLRALAGERRKAVSLYEDAAQRYERLGLAREASAERARAIVTLSQGRHLDEGLRLLQRLDSKRSGALRHPVVEEARQRLALQMLLSSFDSSDGQEIRTTLQNIGAHLFETRRAVDLTELSLLYLDLAVRDDAVAASTDDLVEAVDAVVNLERELGLAASGWVGLQARALLHSKQGERERAVSLWAESLERYEERLLADALHGDPLRVWMGRGQSPFYRRPRFEPHRNLVALLRALDREDEAQGVTDRMARVSQGALWRQPPAAKVLRASTTAGQDFVAVRAQRRGLERQLVKVSFQGGDIPPAEQRDALAPLLAKLRAKEDSAFARLRPSQRLLFRPGVVPEPPAVPPRAPTWLDLSAAPCQIGGRGGADIFLVLSSTTHSEDPEDSAVSPLLTAAKGGVAGPAELAELVWEGLVFLPICRDSAGGAAEDSLALQEAALFSAGASAVVRQLRPAPRRAQEMFRSSLAAAIRDGLGSQMAFDAAMAAVAKRWRSERVRGSWGLRLP